jgi:hypothetical protein
MRTCTPAARRTTFFTSTDPSESPPSSISFRLAAGASWRRLGRVYNSSFPSPAPSLLHQPVFSTALAIIAVTQPNYHSFPPLCTFTDFTQLTRLPSSFFLLLFFFLSPSLLLATTTTLAIIAITQPNYHSFPPLCSFTDFTQLTHLPSVHDYSCYLY